MAVYWDGCVLGQLGTSLAGIGLAVNWAGCVLSWLCTGMAWYWAGCGYKSCWESGWLGTGMAVNLLFMSKCDTYNSLL